MKRIALVTIFDNPNFGTYLQTFALSSIIEKLGGTVQIVHYERPHWRYWNSLFESFKSVNLLHKISRFCWSIAPYIQKRKEQKFIMNNFSVSRRYNSFEDLKSNPPVADVYLTGSDQVWNSIHNRGIDKVFYLAFAPEGKKKCAYAASFGMSEVPQEETEEIKNLLQSYNSISVREFSNVDILNKLGILNVQQVLDPTLLLSKIDWEKMINKKRKPKKKYLLVYSVESKKQDYIISEISKKIAHEMDLKIYGVYYSGFKYKIECCDKNYYYASPIDFLHLIDNASFLVVSSFHGTAFSINMNKEFITVSPRRFNSRIDSLLSLVNLTNRKVSSVEDFNMDILSEKINYNQVNDILSNERMKSLGFIKTNILN